ncbi:hypothetical protein DCC79_03555, partial [bacterium]
MNARLVGILRGLGRDPDRDEVADLLWLAAHIDAPAVSADAGEGRATPQPAEPSADTPAGAADVLPAVDSATDLAQAPGLDPDARDIHLPASGDAAPGAAVAGLPFRSPAARALPAPLDVARALRPLMRRVPSRTRVVLDEDATVERIAQGGVVDPVFRPAMARWLDVALVVDGGASMELWKPTVDAFQRVLEQVGAFREVRRWTMGTAGAGGDPTADLALTPRAATGIAPARRAPRHLADPSGCRLVLVVSDCIAPTWHDGRAATTLAAWRAHGPLALVQVLPPRLWERTAVGRMLASRVQAHAPGTPCVKLAYELASDWLFADVDLDHGWPVPITTLNPAHLAPWARMVAGRNGDWTRGVMVRSSAVWDDGTTGGEGAPGGDGAGGAIEAEERVRAFMASASPTAQRLAASIAAVPVSVRLMHIVQREIVPESDLSHLAEVLCGGLIRRVGSDETGGGTGDAGVRYDFHPGVRDLLLGQTRISRTVDVIQRVSDFIARETGSAPFDFQALIVDPDAADGMTIAAEDEPFAMVTTQVLRRLGGRYAEAAGRLEGRLRQDRGGNQGVDGSEEGDGPPAADDEAPEAPVGSGETPVEVGDVVDTAVDGGVGQSDGGEADDADVLADSLATIGLGEAIDYRPEPASGVDVWEVLGIRAAHRAGLTGRGVRIGILGTGIDAQHPDLAQRVVAYRDFVDEREEPFDPNGHGTFIAGVIAGNGEASDRRWIGVAPGAELVVARVLDAQGNGRRSTVMAGLEWAAAQDGVRVICIGLAGPPFPSDGSDSLCALVDAAVAHGVVVCVAAGNLGPDRRTIGSPSAARQAITVGAVDLTADGGFKVLFFSSRGPTADGRPKPDVLSIGAGLIGSRAQSIRLGAAVDDEYLHLSGTNGAAAVVTGSVALLLQKSPSSTPEEVRDLLTRAMFAVTDTGDDRQLSLGQRIRRRAAGVLGGPRDDARIPDAIGVVNLFDVLDLPKPAVPLPTLRSPEVWRRGITPAQQALLDVMLDVSRPPAERSMAADKLAAIGDPRPGVRLRADGLPDVAWCAVPAGAFTMGGEAYDDEKPI